MATSGVIEKSFHNGFRLRIEWSQSKDIANNRSTINCNLYLVSTSSGYKIYSASRTVNWSIDGSGGTFNAEPVNNNGGQKSYMGSFSRTINHNADGSKSASISASWNFNGYLSGTYYGTITASGTANLDRIPRASQPSVSSSSVNMGSSVTIYTNRPSGTNFTHTLKYSFSGQSGTIATGVATSYSWTPPLSLANRIPNSTSGTCTITCETYSGSTRIGTKTTTLKLNVPSSVVPSISSISHEEHVASVKSAVGAYVQGLSRITFTTNASGSYSSTIKSYELTFEGKTYFGRSISSNVVSGSGNLTATAKVVDSRGRTTTRQVTVYVYPYAPPKITNVNVIRSNSNGTENPLGTYVKVTVSGSFTPLVVSSSQKNTITWRIFSRERGASSWGTAKRSGTISSGSSISITQTGISGYNETKSYEFRIEAQDKFNTTLVLELLSSGTVTMSWGREGVGIGKIYERGALDVGGTAYFEDWQMQNIQWYYIPLLNGAQPYSEGETPQWAKVGEFIILRGAMKNILARATAYASLPAEARPTKSINFSHNTSHDGHARFARWQLFSDGRLVLEGNSDSVFLDWHWYPLHIVYCRNQG